MVSGNLHGGEVGVAGAMLGARVHVWVPLRDPACSTEEGRDAKRSLSRLGHATLTHVSTWLGTGAALFLSSFRHSKIFKPIFYRRFSVE